VHTELATLLTRNAASHGIPQAGPESECLAAPGRVMPVAVRQRVGPFTEPEHAARAAALRYVTDEKPGITRVPAGDGVAFVAPDGTPVEDEETLARIRALAIPPAWTSVWICPIAHGHLQATGRDSRGRKQYRYHKRWTEIRDETKFGRMLVFGKALPRIRRRVRRDLSTPGLSRERVLATIVRLLETTLIRVGNEEYARTNKSFGLTTMLGRHVQIKGPKILFRFRGKGGKAHEIGVSDRRLAALVRRCRDLPGQDLFQYLDDAGQPQPVDSGDVNDYLRAIAGDEFTAKDFRTWAGTLRAARALTEPSDNGDSSAKSRMLRAIESVARELGNTPAVCRKCYIHPRVLEAFESPALLDRWTAATAEGGTAAGLTIAEGALLRFLQRAERRSQARADRRPLPRAERRSQPRAGAA
jgi:DNA topoisomerase-1